MKVIRKGRKQNGWSKEYTCTGSGNGDGGCGAVLLVEQRDLYHTHTSAHDGSGDTFTTFRCSECNVETDMKVPSSIHVYASEREKKSANRSSRD